MLCVGACGFISCSYAYVLIYESNGFVEYCVIIHYVFESYMGIIISGLMNV